MAREEKWFEYIVDIIAHIWGWSRLRLIFKFLKKENIETAG